MAELLALPPKLGDYFTDGSRLVMVTGVKKDWYKVEDAMTGITLEMPMTELAKPGVWRKVVPSGVV